MPSSPELFNAAADIRIIEVLFEMKTKHPSKTDSHITVSAEIKINLQHIGNGTCPCSQDIDLRRCRPEKGICHKSHGIGDQNLFTKTCCKPADPCKGSLQCLSPCIYLNLYVMVFYYRSCDQLREKGYIEKYLAKILLCLCGTAVYIDHIRQCLESKK